MIEPTSLTVCNCGCDTFKIAIDLEYKSLLYECTSCGYIHSEWFDHPHVEYPLGETFKI